MKTYRYILAAAALLLGFSSCSKDDFTAQPEVTEPKEVDITVGAGFAETRTTMTEDGDVIWSATDKIKVNVNETAYDFELKSGEGTTSAIFHAVVSKEDADVLLGKTQGSVSAYYPTSGAVVPSTQTYEEGTFADEMNPMTATYANQTFTFTNNAAIVRVQEVSKDAEKAVLSYTVGETEYTVTMALTAGDTDKNLYFVVVPGAQYFYLSLDGGEAARCEASENTVAGNRYNIVIPKVARVQTKSYPAEWKEFPTIGGALEFFNDQQSTYKTWVSGAKLELYTNVETGEAYTPSNPLKYKVGSIGEVFDLQGYTLTVSNSSSFICEAWSYLNNGTVKTEDVNDVAIIIKGVTKSDYYLKDGLTIDGSVVFDNSIQTVSAGTVKGNVSLTNNSTISISGGTFGGTLSAEEGSAFVITGGTFYQDPSAFVELPKEAYKDGDVWKIRDKVFEYVAEVNGTQYKTLASAYSAVSSGGTIKMIGYTNITSKLSWNKSITLDLNGMTLTSKTSQAFYLSGGTLTVTDNSSKQNGKIVMDGSCSNSSELFRVAGGNIIINGGTFEAAVYSGYVIQSSSETTTSAITVNGGTFLMSQFGCCGIYNLKSQTPVNITGGTFKPTGYSAVAIHMNASSSNPTYTGTLNVSGGRFELPSGTYGIRGYDKGTINIYDGAEFIIKGGTAIHSYATLLNIEGGTFTETSGKVLDSNYQKSNANNAKISGGTFSSTGGSIFEHNSIQTLEISGGTFTAKKNYIFRLFNTGSSAEKPVNISVKGGKFSDDPTKAIRNGDTSKTYDFVPDGYNCSQNSETKLWEVTQQ